MFSDVHGNLGFLEKGLEWLKAQGAGKLVFLGDVVGKSGHNRECLERLFHEAADLIFGNHDRAGLRLLDKELRLGLEARAQRRVRLGENNEILCSHTATDRRVAYKGVGVWRTNYLDNAEKAAAQFRADDFYIFFFGHTHEAVIFEWRGEDEPPRQIPITRNSRVTLHPLRRYLVNPGPMTDIRDTYYENPHRRDFHIDRPSVLLYDSTQRTLRFHFLADPPPDGAVETARARILSSHRSR